MTLYKFNRLLESKGYKLLKCYKSKEVWTNGKKDLTFPVNNDMVHHSVVKKVISEL